jgi:deoxyribose-phosphate aldolase
MNEKLTRIQVAALIDHTILKSEATTEQIEILCKEAKENKFASVCINPCHVELAAKYLKESHVDICTVIGFPLGANTTKVKVYEAEQAIKEGATEIDMVINVGALKEKNYDYVLNDIKEVVNVAKNKALVKVIIETCLLTDEEKAKISHICMDAGADFVKTSTGFNKSGATQEDIELMSSIVHPKLKVKASGGIRKTEDALLMIKSGADRIGVSASISILGGIKG